MPNAEPDQEILFTFKHGSEYIEFVLDTPQDKSFWGWKILPHRKPCKVSKTQKSAFLCIQFWSIECNYCEYFILSSLQLMRNDVDRFGYNEWNPILPSFILTVTALQTVATEEQLSYAVPMLMRYI